jgi:hypothetical protein
MELAFIFLKGELDFDLRRVVEAERAGSPCMGRNLSQTIMQRLHFLLISV